MQTPRLKLPFLAAGQAQKHVTLNEGLSTIDQLVQLSAEAMDVTTPPPAPVEGYCCVPQAAATGAFAGRGGQVAVFVDGAWVFHAPQGGWRCWNRALQRLEVYDGAGWRPVMPDQVERLGINTPASTSNRLAVSSAASLFSHDAGGDHRIVVNKAASGGTAALLLQTGFSGRAEIGLTGSDTLAVKVSANGASWTEALCIDSAGRVGVGASSPQERLHLRGPNVALMAQNTATAQFNVAAISLRGPDSLGTYAQTRMVHGNSNAGATQAYMALSSYSDAGAFTSNLLIYEYQPQLWSVMAGNVARLQVDASSTRPGADNAYSLGSSTRRWSQIWAANGTIQTSDARDKTDIEEMPAAAAAAVVSAVQPILFRWSEGARSVASGDPLSGDARSSARAGRRRHAGFKAQMLHAALSDNGLDCGAWGLADAADPDSRQWIRPDQLIPILWAAVRDLAGRMERMEGR
ncbi:MAG: DUF2793 domain-containing protein [Beijerinckiaceae bacterium]